MPAFRFAGFTSRIYAFLRDTEGELVSLVQPDDVRDFDSAPDSYWVPVDPSAPPVNPPPVNPPDAFPLNPPPDQPANES